ncbi:MAG: class I SAM-dependent methyltransferase [Alphaproteobacteria bacterium]|nr:class I SAM-dependent methyltransferase [Alphaproteobacteria bacterium]NCQ66498.1 class I SAM-dependent methyltransferase [Alphaproteobacteria bacterium]NCT08289.1 class I SAM-dependent methyltransferase [Alphaproteobacteria bacterium]
MWVDAERLKNFYHSNLGTLVQRKITAAIETIWPDVKGEVVAGFGFCHPYLGLFEGEAERILSLMPAPQGARAWPKNKKNLTALVEETQWPLQDKSVDRLLLCHALEYSDQVQKILEECWRVLSDRGELLVIVPNRRSAWAQTTTTPLGYGTPYTGHQLYDVLERANFMPLKPRYCLYAPPGTSLLTLKFSSTFEKYGPLFSKKLGGVVAFPARKQVYALTPRQGHQWLPRAFNPTTP